MKRSVFIFFTVSILLHSNASKAATPLPEDTRFGIILDLTGPAASKLFAHDPSSAMTYSCYVGAAQIFQAFRENAAVKTPEQMYSALLNSKVIKLLDDEAILKERELQAELQYEVVRNDLVAPF